MARQSGRVERHPEVVRNPQLPVNLDRTARDLGAHRRYRVRDLSDWDGRGGVVGRQVLTPEMVRAAHVLGHEALNRGAMRVQIDQTLAVRCVTPRMLVDAHVDNTPRWLQGLRRSAEFPRQSVNRPQDCTVREVIFDTSDRGDSSAIYAYLAGGPPARAVADEADFLQAQLGIAEEDRVGVRPDTVRVPLLNIGYRPGSTQFERFWEAATGIRDDIQDMVVTLGELGCVPRVDFKLIK